MKKLKQKRNPESVDNLKAVDPGSEIISERSLQIIEKHFNISRREITNIYPMKKGMTNSSIAFSINDKKYILRIPGKGTDRLINRENEATVYKTINGLGICDSPVYLDPKTGYKITSFLNNARTCDKDSSDDVIKCMEKLRFLHSLELTVPHTFNLWEQIDFYESLRTPAASAHDDYLLTKKNVFSFRDVIEGMTKKWCLTHIDAVPDNFIFYRDQSEAGEALQLTDWEYSGMQDPLVDIAMFCIYSLYDRGQTDRLIDIYFEGSTNPFNRYKIYTYMSVCGLLWSNWCEYKETFGIRFGEYGELQYKYAKDYYKYAAEFFK